MDHHAWLTCATLALLAATSLPAWSQDRLSTQPAPPVDALVTEGTVTAPPAEVWKVFSTAEGFRRLGVAHCDFDLRIGGLIRAHYDPNGVLGDDGTIHNEILAYEPERMISFRVHQPPKGFPFARETWSRTWSVVTLTDLGDGRTHVRIVGLGYPDTEDGRKMREFFRTGNGWVLQFLQRQYDQTAPAPTGPAHADAPLAPITLTRIVDRPRSEVWQLLATAGGWKQFMNVEARIELHPTGAFELFFAPDNPAGQRGSEGCTVLTCVPEELLSFSWNAPPQYAHARDLRTWVVIRLDEPAPGRTRVRLDHLGFAEQAAAHEDHRAEWEATRAYFVRAWGSVLDALAKSAAQPR
jgi:uncharacterized protein YndB with AHSA1/START domain